MINKEKFKEKDIKRIDNLVNNVDRHTSTLKEQYAKCIQVLENKTDIKIPTLAFGYYIFDIDVWNTLDLPFKVKVDWMEDPGDNYWLKDSYYSGLQDDEGLCTIKLRKGVEHSNLSILWLLLHEFRHYMQFKIPSIKTNINNPNLDYFMKYLISRGNDENTLLHVFHEIMPYEVDANIFACETLGIDYPGSKFELNDYTYSLLK